MARRKQHLKYQAKKGRILKNEGNYLDEQQPNNDDTNKNLATKSQIAKTKASHDKTIEYTKLDKTETKFIRKEIIYIIFVMVFLLVIYVVIYLIFKNTGLDEWLSGFIRLNQ